MIIEPQDRMFIPYDITEGPYAGTIGVAAPYVSRQRVKEIPGALYSKGDECWTIPKSWPAVLALGTIAGLLSYKIKPTPELGAWVKEHGLDWANIRIRSQTLEIGEKDAYFKHQKADADWLSYGDGEIPTRGRLLLSETGIGKTASVLLAIQLIALKGPILVVCPNGVMDTGWMDSIKNFAPFHRAVMVTGSLAKRRKILEEVKSGLYDIAIISYESMRSHTKFRAFPGQALKRCPDCHGPKLSDEETITPDKCQAHPKELNEIEWKLVVADEIHRAMNAKSMTTQALWGVPDGTDALRWGMTGTPVSDRLDQLWPLLHFVDPTAWRVKSSWVEYIAEQGYNFAGIWEIKRIKPERDAEFRKTFEGISRRVLKDQVLDLPPLRRWGSLTRHVGMKPDQKRAYNEMRDEMVTWVDEGRITASNLMVVAGRLTLLASATGYPEAEPEGGWPETEDGKPYPKKMLLRMPSGKVDAIIDDLISGEYEGESVVIATESIRLLYVIHKEMTGRAKIDESNIGIIAGDIHPSDRADSIRDFQEGRKRYILMTMAAGGVGITLTKASTMILAQRSWSPIIMKQTIDRVHRIGSEQHNRINIIDYVTADTIEETQIERLTKKALVLEDIVHDKDRLKKFLKSNS